MICPMVPVPVTLSDPSPKFQGHGVIFMPIDALSVLCAQLTRNLLAVTDAVTDRATLRSRSRSMETACKQRQDGKRV